MADAFLTIEKGLGPEGRIAVVRFDRGDGINALSPEAARQLTAAARSFEDDGETSVVVLAGSAKAFSAGFDLKDAEGQARASMDIGALRRHLKLGPRLTRAWQDMEQITIGAIEGFCIGGGVSLAVALDFRIMAHDAHMRLPEIALGMNMSWQSIPRMLPLIGPARTKQAVILADQRITAAEAYEWGLVEELAEPGGAFEAAMVLAGKIAAQPPIPVAMTKLTVNRLAHALDDLASHMDNDQFALASLTEDAREGVGAFLGRRKARFRDDRAMDEDILNLAIAQGQARITLNRPSRLNAIDPELAEKLVAALSAIDRDPSVKVVVIRGAGGRAFMAGGDLKGFHEAGERAPEAVQRLIAPFHEIVRRIRGLRPPVIAAVHGAVAGGGLALALACDFVIAAADAVFTPAYLKIATTPDGGTTWSVARLLGERRALEWLMLGDPISAQQAADLGLINRVVASEDFDREVQALADRIAAGPAQAQAALKQLVWGATSTPLGDHLDAEAASFLSLSATPDFREGIAAFFERREARFGK